MSGSLKLNFLETHNEQAARHATIMIAGLFTILVGVLAAVGAGASYRSATHGTNVLLEIGHLPVITDIRQLVLGKAEASDNVATPDGRMNVMLFGIGGAGHDGSELTDTVIFTSIDLKEERVGMLSIPRDTAYPLGGGRFQKINAVNAYAEQEHPGQGASVAAKDIGKLLGSRVDHVLKIDFKGFITFVNALDGIDVNVERSFVDVHYPTWDEKVQTVSFKKGPEHMTGERALMFVRSRKGSNGENSDFARDRRQQLVLKVVRDKLFSLGVLTSPEKIANLWSAVSSHIQTDLTVWDMVKLAPLALHLSQDRITSHVLTDEPTGELMASGGDAGYLLFPKKPDWSEIRELAQNPFQTVEERTNRDRPTQPIHVEIKNGTAHTGFASQVSLILKKNGYIVDATGNAVERGYERTVIFDLTNGQKATELARLKKLLDANVSTVRPSTDGTTSSSRQVVYSDNMTAEPISSKTSDFLIIMGESSLSLLAGSTP